MAKEPDERYQSASGLLVDLEECRRQLQQQGRIDEFPLAREDSFARFSIPERLYGRQEQVTRLIDAFAAVAEGATGCVMVAGAPGIGKSVVVNEVHKPIVRSRGFFAAGKFDQFQRQVPYAALSQALRDLVGQVLTESKARLAAVTDELKSALGGNAQLMIDLVPELERVIGPQPPVVKLGPTEEQNRFGATLQQLVAVFARKAHPLVLFLDDLQWSDSASLTAIRSLLTNREIEALLVIGAYRDNEVFPGHPLRLTLAEVGKVIPVETLTLGPLDESTIAQLIADTLHTTPELVRPLGEVVSARTAGNPFFVTELLRSLHQDGLIRHEHEQGRWAWDLAGVARAAVTDSVAEFVLSRLNKLPDESRAVLRLAACVGSRFDLNTLSTISATPMVSVARGLWPAISAGFVIPLDEDYRLVHGQDEIAAIAEAKTIHYRFQHDRVQQAAYDLIPEDERPALHHRIGHLLLEGVDEAGLTEILIEVVNQLNAGRALVVDGAERIQLAELNLRAAQKARDSAAFRPSFDYAAVALELLPDAAWADHYELAQAVHRIYSATGYLCSEFDLANARTEDLLRNVRTPLEKARVYASQVAQFSFINRFDDAIAAGVKGLKLLGASLPEAPGMGTVARELIVSKWLLRGKKIEELIDAPDVDDPGVRIAMRILIDFVPPSYLAGNAELFAASVLKQANLTFKHGNCPEAASAYGSYAVMLAGIGDFDGAYRFGQLALELSDRLGIVESKARTYVLYGLFSHSWNRPWSELPALFETSVQGGLEGGDFLFMAFAAGYICLWNPELDVQGSIESGNRYVDLVSRTKYTNALSAARMARQLFVALAGESTGPLSLSDEGFDEEACLSRMASDDYISGVAICHLFRLQLACIHEDWDRAWQELLSADVHIEALAGSPYMVGYCFFGFLAAAGTAAGGGPSAKKAQGRMGKFSKMMGKWAAHCPENFEQYALMMRAVAAGQKGDVGGAVQLHEDAVKAARRGGFLRNAAIAHELAFRFYLGRDMDLLARTHYRGAMSAWSQWGAKARVAALDAKHPSLAFWAGEEASGRSTDTFTSGSFRSASSSSSELLHGSGLDMALVSKSSLAISEEMQLEKLLAKLLRVLEEAVGAQKVVLLQPAGSDDDDLLVQAESGGDGESRLLQATPLEEHGGVPASIVRYVARSQDKVVLGDASAALRFAADPYLQSHAPKSALVLPIVNQGKLVGVLYLENNAARNAFTVDHLDVLHVLASQAAISISNAQLYEQMSSLTMAYQRFVPRDILEHLGKDSIVDVDLGDHVEKTMTVLFSDIRSFTTLSEQLGPSETFHLLNAYLGRAGQAIRTHGGFIDKYVGDAIMALFDSADDAVDAAVELFAHLRAFNEENEAQGRAPMQIGVGLNTGQLMLGTIGEAGRMDSTVISDAVNVAARIEHLTATSGAPLLISEESYRQLRDPDRHHCRRIGRTRVKGKSQSLVVFEILDALDPATLEKRITLSPKFEQGGELLEAGDPAGARALFEECVAADPEDRAAHYLLGKCGLEHDDEGADSLVIPPPGG